MYAQSVAPTLSQVNVLEALLACLMTRPAAALLTTPTVHLFTAAPSPITPQSTIAEFTEATFTGYAAVVLTALLGPVNSPSGTCEAVFNNASFIAGALTSSQNILGYWVDDGATHWYMGEYFQGPIPIVNPGDFIDLAVMIGLAFIPQY
jgi:hypothetical protein